jgi:hypothetical protein
MNPKISETQEKINDELAKIRGLLERIDQRALTPIQLPRTPDGGVDPRALTPIQLPRTLDELVKIRGLLKRIAKKTKKRGKRKPM